jgi:hypothetical protein
LADLGLDGLDGIRGIDFDFDHALPGLLLGSSFGRHAALTLGLLRPLHCSNLRTIKTSKSSPSKSALATEEIESNRIPGFYSASTSSSSSESNVFYCSQAWPFFLSENET